MIRTPIIIKELWEEHQSHYGYIYLSTDLKRHKMYVGKKELSYFDYDYFGSGTLLMRAYKKRPHDFVCKPIDWADTKEELNEKEKWWIKFLDCLYDINLPVKQRVYYNLLAGGDGGRLPEESLERMRKSRTGKRAGEDHPLYGTHKTQEQKATLREKNLYGKSGRAKKVYKFDMSMNLIFVYESRSQVEIDGFTSSKISSICNKNDRSDDTTYYYQDWIFSSKEDYIKKSILKEIISKDDPLYEEKRSKQISEGNKGKSHPHTEESKEKLRKAHLGTTLSNTTKSKISKNRTGKCVGTDNPNYLGKSMTQKQKEEHSRFMKEKWKTEWGKKTEGIKTQFTSDNSSGKNNSQAKAVVQLTESYELVKEYSYLGEIKKLEPEFPSEEGVRKCCKGKQQKYKGYRWMYKADYEQFLKEVQ